MALFQYRVEYGATYATLSTVADNVQEVFLSYGRRAPLDQYNADTASVTLRYPNGYATPNASWVTGTWIKISGRLAGNVTYKQLWVGRIADVTVDYGIPYVDVPMVGYVGNADYVTLTCEGAFAAFGRVQGEGYAMAANTLGVQTTNASAQSGLSVTTNSQFGDAQLFPATTIDSTWGDWCNRVALTMNGKIVDIGTSIVLVNAFYRIPATFGGFSDTINDANNHPYNQISFSSLADNWYTEVTVDPESFPAATVTSGSAPYRTYLVNTLNASTSQATDYANYLLSTYKTQALRIFSITVSLNAQKGDYPSYGQGYLGTQLTVLFRGTTYQCVIEGGTFSGTPAEGTATFYLSAQDLNNYLILDNAVYGKLDNNRLGY
jgi:hypothetical protein